MPLDRPVRFAYGDLELSDPYLSPRRWARRALCSEDHLGLPLADIDRIFFPNRGGNLRLARSICAACPVQAVCLEFAIGTGTSDGMFGGLSPREREGLTLDI